MSLLDVLFPPALGDGTIRVLSDGRIVRVRFIVKTFRLEKNNEFTEGNIPGLNGEPLEFTRGRPRILSLVLVFDGRATNTDVLPSMRDVARLMNVERDTHAPPVLSFEWSGLALQCVLERAVQQFRSVFPDGRPSRGRMPVVFRERRTLEQLQEEIRRE